MGLEQETTRITLEFVRADKVDDPFGLQLGAQRYIVRQGPGRYSEATLTWDSALLDDLSALAGLQANAEQVARLASKLQRFLRTTSWAADEARLQAALARGERVGVELLSGAAELYSLPWELLTLGAGGYALCETPRALLSYRWPNAQAAQSKPSHPGQRMLFAWSASGGGVGAEEVGAALRTPASTLGGLEELPGLSQRGLREALTTARDEGRPFDSLFLLCHGVVKDNVAALQWVSEDGGPDYVDPNTLRRFLGEHAPELRVVVLAACHGARSSSIGSRVTSLALAVHQGSPEHPGPEAVIASRLPLSIQGATLLAREVAKRMPERGVRTGFLAARRALDPVRGEGAPGSLDHVSLQLLAPEIAAGSAPSPDEDTPTSSPLTAGDLLLAGRFRLLTELSDRGVLTTWQALDLNEGGLAVLHCLAESADDETRALFRQRPKDVRASLPEMAVPMLVSCVEEEGRLVYATRYLDHGTLRKRVIDGTLSLPACLALLAEVAQGVAALHQDHIHHGGLRPGGVFFDAEDQPRLDPPTRQLAIDDDHQDDSRAPGSFFEASDGGARADVYSLAAIAMFCANGGPLQRRPGQPLAELLPELSLPTALSATLERALTLRPDEPAVSAVQLAEALLAPSPPLELPPFADRPAELTWLQSLCDGAFTGDAVVGLVSGAAGSGKTALINEALSRAMARDPELVVLSTSCDGWSAANDPFGPLNRLLQQLLGQQMRGAFTGPAQDLNERRLARMGLATTEALIEHAPGLVGPLLSVDTLREGVQKLQPGGPLLEALDALIARSPAGAKLDPGLVTTQLGRMLRWLAERRHVVVYIDNLQHMDATSLGAVHQLTRAQDLGVLVLGAFRPEDVALGVERGKHPLERVLRALRREGDIELTLDEVGQEARRALLDALLELKEERYTQGFADHLFEHTQGHPLFTLELLEALMERGELERDEAGLWRGRDDLDWSQLPPEVEGVIADRLDRLDEDLRDLLSVASVEGVEFTAEVLARLAEMADRKLLRRLSKDLAERHRLVRAGLAERIGHLVLSHYSFESAMMRNFLYDDMSPGERLRLHGDVAEVLEEFNAERLDEVAHALAHHHERAGNPLEAARWLSRLGDRALRLGAFADAQDDLTRALKLLDQATEPSDAFRLEIVLRLGSIVNAREGWSSENAKRYYDEARVLSEAMEDSQGRAQVLFGFWVFYLVRGELKVARENAEALCALGETSGAEVLRIQGHMARCNSAFWVGDVELCRADFAAIAALYDPEEHADIRVDFGIDPFITAAQLATWSAWLQGDVATADALSESALGAAREIDHPLTLAIALTSVAWHKQHRGDSDGCAIAAARLLALSRRYGFITYEGLAQLFQGWVAARGGELDDGLALMDVGFTAWRESAGALIGTYVCAMRAELLLRAERWAPAIEEASRGLEWVASLGERPYTFELQRIKVVAEWRQAGSAASPSQALLDIALEAEQAGLHMSSLGAALSAVELAGAEEIEPARQALSQHLTRIGEDATAPLLERARAALKV